MAETTRAVANSIIRGVKSSFALENQRAELGNIVELFQGMAMHLEAAADLPGGLEIYRADARLLSDIVSWIEDDSR